MNREPTNIDILRYIAIHKTDKFAAFLNDVSVYGWNCGSANIWTCKDFDEKWLNSPIDVSWFNEEIINEFRETWWGT